MQVVAQESYDPKTWRKLLASLKDIIHKPLPKTNDHGFYDVERTLNGYRTCPFCHNVSFSTKQYNYLDCNICHKEFIDRGTYGFQLVKE